MGEIFTDVMKSEAGPLDAGAASSDNQDNSYLPTISATVYDENLPTMDRPPESIKPIRNIVFTRPGRHGTSSRFAVRYATSLATDSRRKVLLVDTKFTEPDFHALFNLDPNLKGLVELVNSKGEIEESTTKVDQDNLFVLGTGNSQKRSADVINNPYFDNFMSEAQKVFDYIIFDAPPVLSSSVPRVLAPKTDGTILVVESGKTRWQVALRAKKELRYCGAIILGVILSERKYYIPDWIYKRL